MVWFLIFVYAAIGSICGQSLIIRLLEIGNKKEWFVAYVAVWLGCLFVWPVLYPIVSYMIKKVF